MNYDSASWGALALALTILGGVVTWVRWRQRGGLPTLLRGAGLSLAPLALWLTGVLELAADVSSDIGRWAVHLVFSPAVWLGIVLAGVATVLFGVGTYLGNRSSGSGGEVAEKPRRREVTARQDETLTGMDDIDAILRKHGIQ